jgi:curved DNA-binding protein CbpA
MNGQLSEQPLAELIREISAKSSGGRLQLQHDRLKAVIYFAKGELLYAAANLRQLRLREYLLKAGINENALGRYDERQPDLELAKTLTRDHLLSSAMAEQIQARQTADVVRLAFSWTDGSWEFDQRSRLNENLKLTIDTRSLLLEAGRRTSPKFVSSRFRVPAELISPLAEPLVSDSLLPTEVFLLSRLDRPTPLNDLIAVSGLGENETLVLIYSLALAGLLQREHWKSAFRSQATVPEPEPEKHTAPEPSPPEEQLANEADDAESFLARLNNAQTHYEVLDVSNEAAPAHMKTKYYELARRYHPDRFRKAEASLLARMESAFARITQAYDTLRDDRLRANYDAKLRARQRAEEIAEAAPKPVTPQVSPTPARPNTSVKDAAASIAERAEKQFKEGLTALELGEKKAALGLFASSANARPNEPRYRAFYGKLLAEQEHTRRAAETEFQAAIKLDPQNGEYRALLAELYRDLGLLLRARGEAERALAADPNNRKAKDLLRALKSV